MKPSAIILFLLVPIVSFAQDYQGMSEEDTQKMMQQVQKMGSCMENIDQTKLQELEQRSENMEAEMKSLCASGKRDEAQAKAISFGKEFAKDPTIKAMQKCTEMMKGTMPVMPFMEEEDEDSSDQHVCDQNAVNITMEQLAEVDGASGQTVSAIVHQVRKDGVLGKTGKDYFPLTPLSDRITVHSW